MKINRTQIALRWGVCYRTVIREESRHGLKPVATAGCELLFDVRDVDRVGALRSRKVAKSASILTVAQARRKAGAR